VIVFSLKVLVAYGLAFNIDMVDPIEIHQIPPPQLERERFSHCLVARLHQLGAPLIEAFGHFGAGGSLGFCDPESGIAFGYVTNDMGPRWLNPRNRALIEAIYAGF
jgi:CubicO group peptidase (beta-lactamase class C family)